MKQTVIQVVVAVVALVALAAVVYRAQSGAPDPDAPAGAADIKLTHEPAFLPSSKTDAGEGAKPLLRPADDFDRLNEAIEDVEERAGIDNTLGGDDTGPGEATIHPDDVELQLEGQIFLPTTKAPVLPAVLPPSKEEDSE